MRRLLTSALATLAFAGAAAPSSALAQATPCSNGTICPTGFCVDGFCCDTECAGACEACSAVAKGGGEDGECGQAAEGHICGEPGSCSVSFTFTPPDTCDASGACIEGGPPESCEAGDGECSFGACHDQNGCEVYLAPDGNPCSGGLVCADGVCGGEPMGGGGAGAGGDGAGGDATGGDPTGGPGGSTGTGFGGTGGAVSGGSTDVNTSCSCRTAGGNDGSSAALWLMLALAGLGTKMRRRGRRL